MDFKSVVENKISQEELQKQLVRLKDIKDLKPIKELCFKSKNYGSTIPILSVIFERQKPSEVDIADMFSYVRMINSIEPSVIQYIAKLCSSVLIQKTKSKGMIPLFLNLVKIINNAKPTITPAHTELLSLCAKYKLYNLAEETALKLYFSAESKPEHIINFHYLSGCILAILKHYERACLEFKIVIAYPSETITIHAIEAYKKLMLCAAISKQTNVEAFSIAEQYERLLVSYNELCDALGSNADIGKIITGHIDNYKSDKNIGLVNIIQRNEDKDRVINLKLQFSQIVIKDLGKIINKVNEEEVKKFIYALLEDKLVNGKIDEKNGTLTFNEDTTKDMQETIDGQLKSMEQIAPNMEILMQERKIGH